MDGAVSALRQSIGAAGLTLSLDVQRRIMEEVEVGRAVMKEFEDGQFLMVSGSPWR